VGRPLTPHGSGGVTDAGFRLAADAVVTVNDQGSIHQPGVVDVVADRLAWVGPAEGAPPAPGPTATVGGLLMPGLVNTHAHSPMTLLRSAGDGLPLDRWLREAVWPREAQMNGDDIHWGMLLGAHEMLENGITATCEHYLQCRSVLSAVLESGIRAVVTPGIFDFPDAGPEGKWQHFLAEATDLHAEFDGRNGTVSMGFGPHALYTVPEDGMRAVAGAAQEVGALVQTHLNETVAEGLEVRARYDCDAVEALGRTGLLDGRLLAAHVVWASDDELDVLARNDVAVAHCPQSNGKLGSGVARVSAMRDRGIRVGLGTDGPASNDDLDLWEEMRLAPLLARGVAADPSAMATGEALALATRGGADALGLDCGRLDAGRLADIVRLDIDHARFTPALDASELLAHVVWSASSRLVTDVWVGGRQVVAAGHCTSVDGAEARREVNARARRVLADTRAAG
jgi:5-methylthioadenosine/S-adenosylhomocysteine deaminase